MQSNGIPQDKLETYNENSKHVGGLNHASVVGVADCTGELPKDTVFLTGWATAEAEANEIKYFPLLVTRFPCTEKGDLVVVKSVVSKPVSMSSENWEFMASLPFGMIMFGASSHEDPIPKQINNGDLDGDLYTVLWVRRELPSIAAHNCVRKKLIRPHIPLAEFTLYVAFRLPFTFNTITESISCWRRDCEQGMPSLRSKQPTSGGSK